MSSSTTTLTTLNCQQLTNRILNGNSLHFIILSLFFLPLTVSTSLAVQYYISSSGTDANLFLFLIKTIIDFSQNLLTVKTLITVLAFTCFVILPTVTGIALITYSTNQAIHHNHLTFSSTVKSLAHSDIRLLYTVIAQSIKLIILLLAVTFSLIAITEAIKAALAYHFSLFFFPIFINLIVSYVAAITIIFFIVICEPREVITVFRTGLAIAPTLSYLSVSENLGSAVNWILIMQFGTICLQSSLMILKYVVEKVLYVHCMVASGEDITKTAVEGDQVMNWQN